MAIMMCGGVSDEWKQGMMEGQNLVIFTQISFSGLLVSSI